MRVVCLSDTHGLHSGVDVPGGDLLVHAGDLTGTTTFVNASSCDADYRLVNPPIVHDL